MEELFVPILHSFAMENTFTGSLGAFRFRIVPEVVKSTPKEVDFENSTLRATYWHGPFCFEKSEMEDEAVFPLSEEGRQEMIRWLKSKI